MEQAKGNKVNFSLEVDKHRAAAAEMLIHKHNTSWHQATETIEMEIKFISKATTAAASL
jgi:hypothetical protein